MSDDALPLCACEQYYDSHHPECPARRAYEALASRLDCARRLAHSWIDTPFTSMDRDTMRTLGNELLRTIGEKWIAESNPGSAVERHVTNEETQ